MKEILIELYKNRIEYLISKLYRDFNTMNGIGYIGKNYEELNKFKPTEYEKEIYLNSTDKNSTEYQTINKKIIKWRFIDLCTDFEKNSFADLIEKIDKLSEENNKLNSSINKKSKKKFYLIFDTETTGLPKNWNAPISDSDNWPRLVQLAFIFCNKKGKIKFKGNFIIKPNNYEIPLAATKIHDIDNKKALKKGIQIELVLQIFNSYLQKSDVIIGHNLSFDEKIICAEFFRHKIDFDISKKIKICTMENATNFCNIKGVNGLKWPKLTELYFKLFEEHCNETHNAKKDVKITYKCFWELKKREIIV